MKRRQAFGARAAIGLAALLVGMSVAAPAVATEAAGKALLVYHQVTMLEGATGGVGWPMLSGDGSTAVFADSPASGDPATPNRIYVVDLASGEPVEVDACQSR